MRNLIDQYIEGVSRKTERHRTVRVNYPGRMIAYALIYIVHLSFFWNSAHPVALICMGFAAFGVPYMFFSFSYSKKDELRNLITDGLYYGLCFCLWDLAIVPCTVLFSISVMSNYIAGGKKLVPLALISYVLGALIGWNIMEVKPFPTINDLQTAASLLMLFVYVMMMAFMTRSMTLRMINTAMELKAQHDELEEKNRILANLATTDELTGLMNRRSIMETLVNEFALSDRHNRPLSVILLDLDHFKSVNDRYGHAVGDQVLQASAETMRLMMRRTDLVGRYGGEEFMIMLPNTNLDGALELGRKINRELSQIEWPDNPSMRITISGGVAEKQSHDTVDSMIHDADMALYRAKEGGRNQILPWFKESG